MLCHAAPRLLAWRLPGAPNAALACWCRQFVASVDDLNREMEQTFGLQTGSLSSSFQEGMSAGLRDSNSGSRTGPGSSASNSEHVAEQQAAAINRELFEFFGQQHQHQQHQQQQAWTGAAASTLAQHIAAEAGQQQHQQQQGSEEAAHADASSSGQGLSLTHVDASGRAAMVDVSQKRDTLRVATAGARVLLGPAVYALVASNSLAKGDVLTVAQLAGVMGAKQTSSLMPLCHNILLSKVSVDLALVPQASALDITASTTTVGPTGVEMEALTAAAVAALTVYDMVKAASKDVVITDLRLLSKSGGKSGAYLRSAPAEANPARGG